MRVLKEFDLTTEGDRARQRAFGLQTRCVTALYERLFPRYKTQSCWKVLIRCVSVGARPSYRNLLGVYELDLKADTDEFFKLPDAEKKLWAFEQLQRGIEKLRGQTGWAEEPFAAASAQAVALALRNVWRWRAARSPSGLQTAEIWIDHDVQACLITLAVRNRAGKELSRQPLLAEVPDERAFSPHLGALVWASESRVVLTSKDGERSWAVELPSASLSAAAAATE